MFKLWVHPKSDSAVQEYPELPTPNHFIVDDGSPSVLTVPNVPANGRGPLVVLIINDDGLAVGKDQVWHTSPQSVNGTDNTRSMDKRKPIENAYTTGKEKPPSRQLRGYS